MIIDIKDKVKEMSYEEKYDFLTSMKERYIKVLEKQHEAYKKAQEISIKRLDLEREMEYVKEQIEEDEGDRDYHEMVDNSLTRGELE